MASDRWQVDVDGIFHGRGRDQWQYTNGDEACDGDVEEGFN